jgi:hypothetical protein
MTLSPDERRDFGEISRILSSDKDLFALAHLFAEQPAPPGFGAQPTAHHRTYLGAVVALCAAVVAFVAGCVVATGNGSLAIASGALLVLCSAAILAAVLVRHRTRLGPDTVMAEGET